MNRRRLARFALLLALLATLSVGTACSSTLVVADELASTERAAAADERSQTQQGSPSEDLEAEGDWHPPGADLPPGPRLVIQNPDHSIQYVSLDGSRATLAANAPASLLPAGLGGIPMTDGPMVYVRQHSGGLFVLDTKTGD